MSESRTFLANLTTIGRKTGNEHTVELKAVMHDDKIYFSRHFPNSDWWRNSIANSEVKVEFEGKTVSGNASQITDEVLMQKINDLKYPGEERAKEKRVILEIILK